MKIPSIIAILLLLVAIPLSLALFGLAYNYQTFVGFALTVSLIFLTFLLVISSSRLEEHLRRLADLYKIQIGISAMLEAKFPDSYFDPIKLGESLEIFNSVRILHRIECQSTPYWIVFV